MLSTLFSTFPNISLKKTFIHSTYFQSFSIFIQLFFKTDPTKQLKITKKQLKDVIKKHLVFRTSFQKLFSVENFQTCFQV